VQFDAVRARSRRFRLDGCSTFAPPRTVKEACPDNLTPRQTVIQSVRSDRPFSRRRNRQRTPPLAASAGAVCHGRGAPQRPVRQRCSVPLTPPRRPASPGPACRTLSYFGCPQRQRLRPEPAASHESSPSVANAPYPASGLVEREDAGARAVIGRWALPDPDKLIWTVMPHRCPPAICCSSPVMPSSSG